MRLWINVLAATIAACVIFGAKPSHAQDEFWASDFDFEVQFDNIEYSQLLIPPAGTAVRPVKRVHWVWTKVPNTLAYVIVRICDYNDVCQNISGSETGATLLFNSQTSQYPLYVKVEGRQPFGTGPFTPLYVYGTLAVVY